MNKIKRVLSVALCVLMMVSMLAVSQLSFAYAATEGDYTYTVIQAGKATITGYTGTAADLALPTTLGGNTVTAVGDKAFFNNKNLTSVTLTGDIVSIGDAAFQGCTALQSIALTASVASVGDAAFLGCTALKTADMANVTEFGIAVFSGCTALQSLTLTAPAKPDEEIGFMAVLFDGISNAAQPGFPATLKTLTVKVDSTVSAKAFYGMSKVENITILGQPTEIGTAAFSGCKALKNLSVNLSKVQTIKASAFYGCAALTEIDLPKSVTEIGVDAFNGCTALATVTVTDKLVKVGKNAFKGTAWFAAQPAEAVVLGKVFITAADTAETITIPATVASIADSAFEGNKKAKEIIIPANVTYIGINVLKNSKVEDLTIPYLGNAPADRSFQFLGYLFGADTATSNGTAIPSSLTTVELTGGTQIPAGAFSGASKLKYISIPETVTDIKSDAFANCTALTGVLYNAKNAVIGEGAFSGCDNMETVVFGDKVETIPTYLCTGNAKLTVADIPASVKTIEARAFAGCYNITSINFDAVACTAIAADAFDYCHKLANIKLGENVTHIPANLFSRYGGSNITELVIPEQVTSIAPSAFTNCTALTTLDYQATSCVIGPAAFSGCKKLSTIKLGKNVTVIPQNLYTGNTVITKVDLPEQITSIEDLAFDGCTALKEINVSDNLASIGKSILSNTAWYDMQADGPIYLGKIFYGYKGQLPADGSVTINNGTVAIAAGAFEGNGALQNVFVPNSVSVIGEDAFRMTNATITCYTTATNVIDYAANNSITVNQISCPDTNVYYRVIKEATGDAIGTLEIVCADCSQILGIESYTSAAELADKWVETVAPTCTVAGILTKGTETKTIPATGHQNTVWKETTAPTCTTEGVKTEYCEDCDTALPTTGSIDKIPHTAGAWQQIRLPRTYCTGLNAILCTECGEMLQSKTLPKLEKGTPLEAILDVISSEWYYDTVEFALANGFFNGIDANTFAPNETMTRAMFVTVLGRLAGVKVENDVRTAFTDVKKNLYYTGYVKWAADNGIVNGVTKTKFQPNDAITREQICTMIVRYCNYAGIQLNTAEKPQLFRDADMISPYAFNAVMICQSAGLVKGRGDRYFAPKATATRAEVAQIFMNLCLGYLVVE